MQHPPSRPAPWQWVLFALGALLAWKLSEVLLLAFAGILLALALRSAMAPLTRRTGWPERWVLALVVLAALAVLALLVWLAGAALAEQSQALRQTLPEALAKWRAWLQGSLIGRWLLDAWGRLTPEDLARVSGFASGTLNATLGVIGALGTVVLLLVLGVYLAAEPYTYRDGFIALLPERQRARVHRMFNSATEALSRWLMAQGISMLVVGLLTGAGLALIGMPLALLLGVIAGLLEFVPYFGPIVSAVLVVAVAFSEGADQAWRAAGVCLVVQQLEAYVVQPQVQRWAVRLPPALSLLSVLLFGLLFELPGVLLASPLLVLLIALVREALRERERRTRLATVR